MVTLSVTISEEVYRRLQQLAEDTGHDIEEVLTLIPLLTTKVLDEFSTIPVKNLSDSELLAVAESRMEKHESERMSELLQKQQQNQLDESEQKELDILFGIYNAGQLRKAEAVVEVIDRGLKDKMRLS